ncbi:dihydropteroate synthase [Falsiroseomonas selenitidurans]|uniref:dihydropteroate synthase n=1 Tax=Falsiroseomonas selenitidurans TaxID=2716335 RepID=A0ABX1E921_9PROT|nr:dihydropteroate synthase [Falsiroseomonas selenitidurans]NKC33734.1 dihydropteroate synthase [Falsiroseomonas selenitidurans]
MTETWVEPLGLIQGQAAAAALAADLALPLAGGPLAFTLVRLIGWDSPTTPLPLSDVPEIWHAQVLALTRPPPRFAGLPLPAESGRPLVMGIINVTPDSFSDGGRGIAESIAAGHAMLEAGADLLDIGGESTRPGAMPVAPEEECRRVLPVIRELAKAATISVDTRNAATMLAALEAGAEIVNDITALRHDPAAARVLARSEASVILMHMLGEDPRTMQQDPRYADVALEVAQFLSDRVLAAERMGLKRDRLAVDPGIGFGKRLPHNLALMDRLPLLAGIGCPIVFGASRKRFLGTLSGVEAAGQRVQASVAAALAAAGQGAAMVRVHDVAETVQALSVWQALAGGGLAEDEEEG